MEFNRILIEWYRKNKRLLPWRETNDPYRIWVSEVILQQTRVEQGLAYYHKFLEHFPDIRTLGQVEEDRLMKVWQGLGYYSRARHMQQAARDIHDRFDGRFPQTYLQIKSLKGVGDYTAAAVASIAFGEPHPVVDGNVLRVMARFAGIADPVNTATAKRQVKAVMETLMDKDNPGDFNQAVMELGALICKPLNPLCRECPVHETCYALRHGRTGSLPVMKKDGPVKTIHINYLVITSGEGKESCAWVRKRSGLGIWRNLYDFPEAGDQVELKPDDLPHDNNFLLLMGGHPFDVKADSWFLRHRLTHRELRIRFFAVRASGFHHDELVKVPVNELFKLPVPRPVEIFLKKFISDRVYF